MDDLYNYYRLSSELTILENHVVSIEGLLFQYNKCEKIMREFSLEENDSFFSNVKKLGKNIWVTIKTFFRRMVNFFKTLGNKFWIFFKKTKYKWVSNGIKDIKEKYFPDKNFERFALAVDDTEYALGISFSAFMTFFTDSPGKDGSHVRILFFKFHFKSLFENLFKIINKYIVEIHRSSASKDETGGGEYEDIDGIVDMIKKLTDLLKCKSVNDVYVGINSFIDKYQKTDKSNAKFCKEIHSLFKDMYDRMNNGQFTESTPEQLFYLLQVAASSLKAEAFKQGGIQSMLFVKRVGSTNKKLIGLLDSAERNSDKYVVEKLKSLMKLMSAISSLCYSIINAQIRFCKFYYKESKKNRNSIRSDKKISKTMRGGGFIGKTIKKPLKIVKKRILNR